MKRLFPFPSRDSGSKGVVTGQNIIIFFAWKAFNFLIGDNTDLFFVIFVISLKKIIYRNIRLNICGMSF